MGADQTPLEPRSGETLKSQGPNAVRCRRDGCGAGGINSPYRAVVSNPFVGVVSCGVCHHCGHDLGYCARCNGNEWCHYCESYYRFPTHAYLDNMPAIPHACAVFEVGGVRTWNPAWNYCKEPLVATIVTCISVGPPSRFCGCRKCEDAIHDRV
jgi:hypothetical protein